MTPGAEWLLTLRCFFEKGIITEPLWANPILYMLDWFERASKKTFFLRAPVSLEAFVRRWFSLKSTGRIDCFWSYLKLTLSWSDVWKLSCWVEHLLVQVTTAGKEQLNRFEQLVVSLINCFPLCMKSFSFSSSGPNTDLHRHKQPN